MNFSLSANMAGFCSDSHIYHMCPLCYEQRSVHHTTCNCNMLANNLWTQSTVYVSYKLAI